MSKKFRCPRPVNRLITWRNKGLNGPLGQNIGNGRCLFNPGQYWSPFAQGARAVHGVVLTSTGIEITFSACVSISGLTGIEVRIDGGAWTQVTGETQMSDTVYRFVTPNIDPGDVVRWRYIGGSGTIVDCDGGEDIGDQEIPVDNQLVLVGNFVLLSTGGMNIVVLSNGDTANTDDGVQTSDAP